jgi:hypothetical protein
MLFSFRLPRASSALLLALGLAACGGIESRMQNSDIRLQENHLLTAGFKIMLADTQEKQKMLYTLPADTITSLPQGQTVWYVYADPKVCSCLYVGRPQEYQYLQRLGLEAGISNQRLAAHELQEDYQSGWGPQGAWGNFNNIIGGNNPLGHPDWDPQ